MKQIKTTALNELLANEENYFVDHSENGWLSLYFRVDHKVIAMIIVEPRNESWAFTMCRGGYDKHQKQIKKALKRVAVNKDIKLK